MSARLSNIQIRIVSGRARGPLELSKWSMDLPGTKSFAVRYLRETRKANPSFYFRLQREPANKRARKYYPRVGRWWYSVALCRKRADVITKLSQADAVEAFKIAQSCGAFD